MKSYVEKHSDKIYVYYNDYVIKYDEIDLKNERFTDKSRNGKKLSEEDRINAGKLAQKFINNDYKVTDQYTIYDIEDDKCKLVKGKEKEKIIAMNNGNMVFTALLLVPLFSAFMYIIYRAYGLNLWYYFLIVFYLNFIIGIIRYPFLIKKYRKENLYHVKAKIVNKHLSFSRGEHGNLYYYVWLSIDNHEISKKFPVDSLIYSLNVGEELDLYYIKYKRRPFVYITTLEERKREILDKEFETK